MDDGDLNRLEISALVDQGLEADWYELPANDVDRAAYALCQLRRARALDDGPGEADEAVRTALAGASAEALVWLTSRAISYMDESWFPEAVERRFPDA